MERVISKEAIHPYWLVNKLSENENDPKEGYQLMKEIGKELIDRGRSGDIDFCSMCVVEGLTLWTTTGLSIEETVSKVMETYNV